MSMRRPPFDQDPIRTDAELTALWDIYLDPEPFRFRAVWLLFLDGTGRPAGPVITIDEMPDGPYELEVEDLVTLCRGILDGPGNGGGSVALALTRPGGDPWTVSDRAWGRFLLRAAAEVGGQIWPVHRAHGAGLEQFALASRA